ncbi:hypothetical protein BDP27DRAFT_1404828 [Rhodocollybia butyracea]|uniref:Uncharacterized protein n=1 Tax=Rhodocollybia butyracea TaxID=206335 RepID=A0A9P5PLI5_9AGAR|nr:hypothetical protein BDP27DRAFT_1404828 [Rhodocollybia butyracea]
MPGWHCTIVPNCPFEQFSRSFMRHKGDYHSKFNSFPYEGRSETMHRRSDDGHPPPETTKYSDYSREDALPQTKFPSLTPLPSGRHSRTSTSPKALRASRITRTKKRVLNDALSTDGYRRTRSSDYTIFLSSDSDSDDTKTDDTSVAAGSGSRDSTSHSPTDVQAHPGPSGLRHPKEPVQSHHALRNLPTETTLKLKSYVYPSPPQDRRPLSQPSPTSSSGITASTRSPPALPLTPNQPKRKAEELDRKSVIIDLKKVRNDMKNSTNQPLFQLEGAGPSTTTSSSYTSLVHDVVGNPQGDQNCNTQSSGLPSRSTIPSSLSETDTLVQQVARLKRERAMLDEEVARKRAEASRLLESIWMPVLTLLADEELYRDPGGRKSC